MRSVFINRNSLREIIIVRSLKFELSHLRSLELMHTSKEQRLPTSYTYTIISNMKLGAECYELAVGNHCNENVQILNL